MGNYSGWFCDRTALSKQTVRRERGSLNSASKNSLAMLVAFLLCSLPLIVCQVTQLPSPLPVFPNSPTLAPWVYIGLYYTDTGPKSCAL